MFHLRAQILTVTRVGGYAARTILRNRTGAHDRNMLNEGRTGEVDRRPGMELSIEIRRHVVSPYEGKTLLMQANRTSLCFRSVAVRKVSFCECFLCRFCVKRGKRAFDMMRNFRDGFALKQSDFGERFAARQPPKAC